MHLRSGLLLSGLMAVLLAFAHPAEARGPSASGQLVRATLHSRALEGNLLGDSADQEVHVYLPPSYASSPKRRYPVVYLLHGYGGSPGDWTRQDFAERLDVLMNAGALPELILVVPNGRNRYGGAFYMDSSVTGGWEQYVVKDLVAHVDGTYRTLARPESRGLTGHSMGGFGAVRLGMPHVYELYEGTHNSRVHERFFTRVLPFFAQVLGGANPSP